MTPERLSRELRRGDDADLTRRRGASVLTLGAIGALSVVALYQLGILKHVPEPPLPLLDADAVDASAEAYRVLSMPDGVLGIGSYAATLGLIAMGGTDRARERPWIPLALAAKALVDSVQAGRLTWTQWSGHRAFCSWCMIAAAATWATLPLVLPEARTAWRRLRDRA